MTCRVMFNFADSVGAGSAPRGTQRAYRVFIFVYNPSELFSCDLI